MNEPTCNDYYKHAPEEEKKDRDTKAIRQFAWHLVELLKENCEIFD